MNESPTSSLTPTAEPSTGSARSSPPTRLVPLSAAGRIGAGFVLGLAVIGFPIVVETAHAQWVLGDLFGSAWNRVLFSIATLAFAAVAGALVGWAAGLSLAMANLVARALSGSRPSRLARARRIASIEALILAAAIVSAAIVVHSSLDAQLRRILNAVLLMLRGRIGFLTEVYFDQPLPGWAIALGASVPAALVAWWWRHAAIRDAEAALEPANRRPARAVLRLVFVLGFLALSLAIYALTATTYTNQYRDLHLVGLLASGVSFAAALWFLPSRSRSKLERPFRSGRVHLAWMAAAGLALVAGHLVIEHRRSVEALVMWRTDGARKLVAIARELSDRDGDGWSGWFGGEDPNDGDPEIGPWWTASGSPGTASSPDPGAVAGRSDFTLPEPIDHVALVSIDAVRTDVTGTFGGSPSCTPRIDAFAQECIRFHRAYAPASFTHITYPSMLASRHPTALRGVPRGQTFPEVAFAAGIQTSGIFCAFFRELGDFQYEDTSIPHDAVEPSKASAALVRRELERPAERALLWVHFIDPHSPYEARSKPARTNWERYLTEVRAADAEIGDLLPEIRRKWGPRTAILVFADHGEEFGEHGSGFHGITAYEELVHVPLLLSVPGLAPRDVTRTVSLVSVGATVLDLLHVARPASFHGRSLLPMARDGVDPAFDHRVLVVNNDDMVGFIEPEGRWKLVFDTRNAFEELYDLVADPRERTNLIDARPDVADSMRQAYLRWRRELLAP